MNEFEQEMSSQKQLYEHQLEEMRKHITELENQQSVSRQKLKDKSMMEEEGAESVQLLEQQYRELKMKSEQEMAELIDNNNSLQ